MDLFINKLAEGTAIKATDYTVFDVANTTTGSFSTQKISYASFTKQLSSDISANVKTLIDALQANLNTTNTNLANKLDKKGLTYNASERMTGTLYIPTLCATEIAHFSNNINVYNNFIQNVKDPVLGQDAVNKRTLLSAISAIDIPGGGSFLAKSGDAMTGGNLTLFNEPTSAKHSTTKKYVDDQITPLNTTINGISNLLKNYVALSGGAGATMTSGFITAPNVNPPTDDKHLSNKKYVDDQITTRTASFVTTTTLGTMYVAKAGDTMTGALNLPLSAPNADTQATNKKYVDDKFTNINLSNYLTVASANSTYLKKDGDTMTAGDLTLFRDPTQPKHATTMQWVSGQITTRTANFITNTTADVSYVRKTGDSMSGFLTLNAPPTANNHSSTKKYVDDQISSNISSLSSSYVKKAGDTMNGSLYLIGPPVSTNEAATKGYVDGCNVYSLNVTAITADLTHANSVVGINNAAPITFTIPNNTTAPFVIGTNIVIHQQGIGQINIIGNAGVTILAATNKTRTFTKDSCVALFKVAINSWLLGGDLI